METFVHQTLGEEKIKTICEQLSLSKKDREIVDSILIEWEKNLGRPDKKMAIALQKCESADNQTMIMKAIFIISMELAKKRQA